MGNALILCNNNNQYSLLF